MIGRGNADNQEKKFEIQKFVHIHFDYLFIFKFNIEQNNKHNKISTALFNIIKINNDLNIWGNLGN